MKSYINQIKKKLSNNKDKFSFKLILFILLFTIYFIIYYSNSNISMDEIWNYGFAYNISNGLIPYLDFNMIQTPLYAYFLAGLIKLFGNHFIVMVIFNSFLSALLHHFLIKKYGYKTLFLFPCLIISNSTCYNFLSLLLFIILLNIDYQDNNEYLNGLIISLMIFTKQTIGGVLLIVSFLLSKNKKKYLIGFLPICIIYLIYLILTNSLYNFFDYCLFSLIDFTSGNAFLSVNFTIIFYILSLILLIKLNIHNRFKNKELIYILTFQIMAVPIFDYNHTIISIIPFLAYLLKNTCRDKLDNYISLIITVFYTIPTIMFIVYSIISIPSNIYYIDNSFLNGKSVSFNLQNVHNLMDNNEYQGYKIYHLYLDSYLYKLEHNQTLEKYDLNLVGNLGYHGEDKLINEINNNCNKQACLLLIDHDIDSDTQVNHKINNYVKDHYKFDKQKYNIDFYVNELPNKK